MNERIKLVIHFEVDLFKISNTYHIALHICVLLEKLKKQNKLSPNLYLPLDFSKQTLENRIILSINIQSDFFITALGAKNGARSTEN